MSQMNIDRAIASIPAFVKPIPVREKTPRQIRYEEVQERKAKDAGIAAAAIRSGIDCEKDLKPLIIELRQKKLTYKWISEITGATYGYVRNICWQCGLTNEAIRNK